MRRKAAGIFLMKEKFQVATRANLDKLILEKVSDALTADQKKNFVRNLLQEMKRNKIVRNVEGKRGKGAKWELYKQE
jgi:ATP-dependent DNA helicase RecG